MVIEVSLRVKSHIIYISVSFSSKIQTVEKPIQNLNEASTSSLFDLNQIPCDYLQLGRPSPSSPSFIGDYTIAADSQTKIPQNPCSSSLLLLDYNTAESEKTNPQNPNSQSSVPCCKSRKRRGVQLRKRTGGGLKKAKVAPFTWVGKETPEWLVQLMRDMNVTGDAKLVFEKVLSLTDVNPAQSRLLIPFNQLQRNDFLTPAESSHINEDGKKPGVKAILVNQISEKWTVNFKIWEMMKKDSGNGSLNYCLNGGWNGFVKANGLKEGHNISLWSFRCNGMLYFSIVLLTRHLT